MRMFSSGQIGRRRFALAVVAIATAWTFGLAPARAQGDQAAGDPAAFVQQMGERAAAVLDDQSLSVAARKQALQRLLRSHFDVAAISRFVLGRHWQAISEAERAEFNQIFGDFVMATYGRHLDAFAGYRLEVGRAIDKDKHGVFVTSKIRRAGETMHVVWRLRESGDGWRVVDVILEGVSMALTHRAEIDAVIRNSRMAGLLDRMRALIAAAAEEQQTAGAS